ncbi:DUF1569 domain-containing protein [Acidicapsa ligni]|uniref:DUF1569 domain-containing protein n=1 Tax=Acidicapsa ligni TaxID=542300 RepID=UPI0021DF92B3|nr:DUF1569 domain-containing protein [Acidicapsa ligni]
MPISKLWRMKSLYDSSAAEEIKHRLAAITPTSERLWGKMNAAQMLAHCCLNLETACGDNVQPRSFIGKLIGPLFKSEFSRDKLWRKNSPTVPAYIISEERDLNAERERLLLLIDRFQKGGPVACTQAPHAFFGKLSVEEWGKGMYKHLDHHLRQFNL